MTVHDLAFLKVSHQPSSYTRLYWQYLLRESVRRAQRIIAVSEQTYDELVVTGTVGAERIRLIHHAQRPISLFADLSPEETQMTSRAYARAMLRVYQEVLDIDELPIPPIASTGTLPAKLEKDHPSVSGILKPLLPGKFN